MKILLVQNMIYVPTFGGANKANRLLLEGLAERGHRCLAIAPATGVKVSVETREDFLRELAVRGLAPAASEPGVDRFECRGVEVRAVTRPSELAARVDSCIRDEEPDWILVTSEDPDQVLLETALAASPRVVYLVHTPLMLPFGPSSFVANPAKTELFREVAGVITVSRFTRDVIRRWAGTDAAVIPFPVYGAGPFPERGSFDRGEVVLVNPCAYKGLPIFAELARRFPETAFAAVPTWGTTAADRALLESLPNVRLRAPCDDIDEIFRHTRILLMPSLWTENFPLLPIEAMSHGLPVMASDAGGLPEAKLGVDYVLPVRPIERYEERLDDRGNPIAVVPEQDVEPWAEALERLLTDESCYRRLSAESRDAARGFRDRVGVAPFEDYLASLQPGDARVRPAAREAPAAAGLRDRLGELSPDKLALLARRLRRKKGEEPCRP